MDSGKKDRKISTSNAADYNARHGKEIEDCNNNFINHLKTAREAKGYTQEKAAKVLDIQLVTYRKIEQGNNRKDVAFFLNSLATAFGVSADYLVGLSESQHPDYDKLTEQTGLNDKSIQVLTELFRQDGGDDRRGVIDFINCFFGNGECSLYFFEHLSLKLQDLYESAAPDSPKRTLYNQIVLGISEWIMDYLNKVVVPTYKQIREEGSYESPTMEHYLSAVPDKRIVNKYFFYNHTL